MTPPFGFDDDPEDIPRITKLSERFVTKAGRPHRCSLCHGEIPKGDRYRRTVYLIDGELETVAEHVSGPCVDALHEPGYQPRRALP